MIKIIVTGATGRMGSSIIRMAKLDNEFQIAGALESKDNPAIGTGEPQISFDIEKIISDCDVVIDFTTPVATFQYLEYAKKNKKAIIIGTTGFDSNGEQQIKIASERIPILFSPNMSIGVNILFSLVGQIAKMIPDYDVEIVELHHNQKKDSPSGTAAKLSQIIADSLDRDIAKVGIYGRKGIVGARKKEEIGIMAVRAGDIVGEHTVYFAGSGERIEITHRAHSRDPLVAGALRAAKWIVKQSPGLYTMKDVLSAK